METLQFYQLSYKKLRLYKARKGIVRKAFELPFFYLAFLSFFRLSEKFLLSSSPLSSVKVKIIIQRVWKGIFGIRDLTKIRCGNRENDKYIDGIRDLTVPREPGLAKNWARDAGFMFVCLSGMAETVTTHRF